MSAPADRPNYAREIRYALVDVRLVCERLGLVGGKNSFQRQAGGGLLIRCPWHDEKTPSCSVRIARDGTIAIRCHGCGVTGDVLTLVAAVHKYDMRSDFRDVLRAAADLGGLHAILAELDTRGAPSTPRQPIAPPPVSEEPERDYPPAGEVAALWDACTPVGDDPDVAAWVRLRALDPDAIDGRELARALPRTGRLPRWAVCRGGSWLETGYRIIVPMFDALGDLRTVRAGRIIDGDGPKRRPPFGHKASGVVMADAFGVAMLNGKRTPGRLVIVEGEPDFWTWASRIGGTGTATIGIVTGSWTDAFAARVATGTTVIVRTDHDTAGDAYAKDITKSFRGRCFVQRGGVGS